MKAVAASVPLKRELTLLANNSTAGEFPTRWSPTLRDCMLTMSTPEPEKDPTRFDAASPSGIARSRTLEDLSGRESATQTHILGTRVGCLPCQQQQTRCWNRYWKRLRRHSQSFFSQPVRAYSAQHTVEYSSDSSHRIPRSNTTKAKKGISGRSTQETYSTLPTTTTQHPYTSKCLGPPGYSRHRLL